ncbi:MAG: protein-disulfide reductase DsbD [Burkholderiales bacterium]
MLSRLFMIVVWVLASAAAGASTPELLEPDQAFRFSARATAADAIEVRYQVAPGYYLYRDKFKFTVEPLPAELGAPELPPGVRKKDEFFGEVETYRGEVRVKLPVRNAKAGDTLELVATSQGCADVGVCYVPHEQKARIVLAAVGTASDAGQGFFSSSGSGAGGVGGGPGDDEGVIGRLFHGGLALLILSFFGFGLLLSFTPCVLPMIPILSGIVVGRGRKVTRLHAFALSAAYVLGMAITYAVAGVLAGLSGAMLSAAFQNAWVVGTFAALFVLLAGSMLGLYQIQLPATVQSRLAAASNRLHGGHLAAVFGMGAISALIVGPCVAAPLAGALLYISQSRDVVLGGSALFAMGLGMGVPLLVVGASAGALLPKAGPWMDTVNRFFGVLLLGVAIYLVAPLVPLWVEMLAWAALLTLTGVHLRAIDPLPPNAHGFERFAKGIGVLALVAGVAFLVGALSGSRDVLQPLSGLRSAAAPVAAPVAFTRVNSIPDLDRAVAGAAGTPVMLDFYADWCVSCKEMERYTFSDPAVQRRLEGMVKLQVDVTANSPQHQALLHRFRLFGPPGIIFFDREGRELRSVRVIGFQSAARFASVLDKVLAADSSP